MIASPLRRTIQTASLCFGPSLANGHCRPDILALPEIQETSDFPCDTGSALDILAGFLQESHISVDLQLVTPGWNIKKIDNKWSPSANALNKRAIEARLFLRSKIIELQNSGIMDPEIVVVSHGGILHYLTEDWEDSKIYNSKSDLASISAPYVSTYPPTELIPHLILVAKHKVDKTAWAVPGSGWTNTEYRSFSFAQSEPSPISSSVSAPNSTGYLNHINYDGTRSHVDDFENATLRETDQSRSRRGKLHPPHDREKQSQHFANAMKNDTPTSTLVVVAEVQESDSDDGHASLVKVLSHDAEKVDKMGTIRKVEKSTDIIVRTRNRRRSSVAAVGA